MSPATPHVAPPEANPFVRALRVLRERWWAVLAATLVCAVTALVVSLGADEQYDATATLLFSESQIPEAVLGTDVFAPSIDPEREVSTRVLLITSERVASTARRTLRDRRSPSELASAVTVTPESGADVVRVTARDTDASTAADIANAFADGYVRYRRETQLENLDAAERELRAQLARLPPTATRDRRDLEDTLGRLVELQAVAFGDAEVVDRATEPAEPSAPNPRRDVLLAALLGLALGVAIAFLLDLFDRRVKSTEDFERAYRLPVLARIPQRAFEARSSEERAQAFEQYRILRNSLTYVSLSREVRVIVVTSAVPGEGKTTVAVNLARAVALSGQRVALVEADLRRPSFGSHFRLDGNTGLTTALVARQPVASLLHGGVPGLRDLHVLPSGPLPPNAAELLSSGAMEEVLAELKERVDLVIVDAPPVVPVADGQVLLDLEQVDASIVVGRAYLATRDQVRRARAILTQRRLEPVGLVVTGLREQASEDYYGGTGRQAFVDYRGGLGSAPGERPERLRPTPTRR